MKSYIYTFILLIAFSEGIKAQEILTLKDAVAIALENNYDIKLSSNNVEIAKENVSYGNAGMFPLVTGNFTQNNNLQNSTQTQQNGEVRSLDNAKNNSMTYGVSMGWTIFDGLGMFSRYESFKELQKQGELQLKSTILQRVSDVINTYYILVQEKSLLEAIDSSLVISKERLQIAENRFSIGKASKLEVLNVQVNLNSDETSRLLQMNVIKNLKTTLNNLLVRDLNEDFDVINNFQLNDQLVLETLLVQAHEHNPDLLNIGLSKRLAELELKNIKSGRYPVVRLNAGYNFSQSESSLGFVAHSKSKGLNYGVSASLNIFDGFNQRRNERIAKLRIKNADVMLDKEKGNLEMTMTQAFQIYQTNMSLTRFEKKNESIAKQNLEITLAKFKIGTISSVEFRDAQENYINAITRHNTAKLQAKLSELLLKELVGKIDVYE